MALQVVKAASFLVIPQFQAALGQRKSQRSATVWRRLPGCGRLARSSRERPWFQRWTQTVSSLIQGAYGISDICLSVPSVVGRRGVEQHVEIKLWPKEQMALQASARALKETLAKVKA